MTDGAEADFAAVANEVTGPWPQVVQAWEQFRAQHGLFLSAASGDTDQQGFLVQAFGSAYAKKRLDALVDALEERELVGPGFAAAVAPLCTRSFHMQAIVNNVWRAQRVDASMRAVVRARKNVCRIAIDGAHRGTGVLIRPNLVATAAHVVEPLVDAAGMAAPNSLARLTLHFSSILPDDPDDEDDDQEEGDEPAPVVARLHREWLAYYSAPAPQENRGQSITSVAGIAEHGPWDLAIIRLFVPPAQGMKGYARLGGSPRAPSFGVYVLHHPADDQGAASRMLWSVGQVRQALGANAPLRWLHNANTSYGSSGAPCFDDGWKLVALHQAGPHKILDPEQNNRAVPIHAWAQSIDAWAAHAASVPFLTVVVTEKGECISVLGRRELQAALWRAMNSGDAAEQRVFTVRGNAGLGKGFTLVIVRALAQLAGHAVAAVDMRNAQADDPTEFARRVTGALAAELPATSVAPSGLTSPLRDLRNDVAPALLRELGQIAAGRQLWLVLTGWDDDAFPMSHPLRQLVELVVAGLAMAPGLHLVLTGWSDPPVGAFAETLAEPGAQDVVDDVLGSLMPGGETPPDWMTQMVKGAVAGMLAQQPAGKPFLRARATAERVLAFVVGMRAPLAAAVGSAA